jgi:hypothetical protein
VRGAPSTSDCVLARIVLYQVKTVVFIEVLLSKIFDQICETVLFNSIIFGVEGWQLEVAALRQPEQVSGVNLSCLEIHLKSLPSPTILLVVEPEWINWKKRPVSNVVMDPSSREMAWALVVCDPSML